MGTAGGRTPTLLEPPAVPREAELCRGGWRSRALTQDGGVSSSAVASLRSCRKAALASLHLPPWGSLVPSFKPLWMCPSPLSAPGLGCGSSPLLTAVGKKRKNANKLLPLPLPPPSLQML